MTANATSPHIALIVEGAGDHAAVPLLFRRYLGSQGDWRDLFIAPLAANGLGNLTKPGGLEKFVAIAESRPGCRGVIVVVDADRECIKDVADSFRSRLTATRVPVLIILADKNFEDWLHASIETLGLGLDVEYEVTRSGSAALADALGSDSYTKPYHQPKFAALIDIDVARGRNPSLDRALSRLETFVGALTIP